MAISKGIQFHSFTATEKAKLREGTMSMRSDWVKKMEKKMPSRQILDDVVAAGKKP